MIQDLISNFKNTVVEIATPFSTGTGFLLGDAEYGLVVTNNHVIDGNKEIIIEGISDPT